MSLITTDVVAAEIAWRYGDRRSPLRPAARIRRDVRELVRRANRRGADVATAYEAASPLQVGRRDEAPIAR